MITGAYYLKRGDTSDIEDFRMTYRLRLARVILQSTGIEPNIKHDKTAHDVFNDCDYRCKAEWAEWVNDDIFEHAFRLADEIQTQQGAFNRNKAYELKRDK